jgi:hypothetical protein
MTPIVLIFGLISGLILSLMMLLTMPFMDRIGFEWAEVIGYTTIVASSLLIYFGVRSYRDKAAGGSLTFGRAFTVGLLIAVVSAACYVITWEIVSRTVVTDFPEKYSAHLVEKARAAGKSAQEIEATRQEVAGTMEMLKNPAMRLPMVFLEPFMIGFVFALISAVVLRRKPAAGVSV